jgi:hypothetical protein
MVLERKIFIIQIAARFEDELSETEAKFFSFRSETEGVLCWFRFEAKL